MTTATLETREAIGSIVFPADPCARAAMILAQLDGNDGAARNAAIVALAQSDAETIFLVEKEVARSVSLYDGPEDDFSDWRALDGEPFHPTEGHR